jgi:hypothetical protein
MSFSTRIAFDQVQVMGAETVGFAAKFTGHFNDAVHGRMVAVVFR